MSIKTTTYRKSYVDVPIDVSKFKEFMAWYNKGGNLNDLNLDEYVKVIKLLESAFDKEFSNINCVSSGYKTSSCYTQVGPFSFYNYWSEEEYVKSLGQIVNRPQSEYDPKKQDINIIAASELKEKYSNKIKFKIMPVVTIGIYQNASLIKQLENSVEISDKEHKLYKKLFPSLTKSILVGVAGVLVSLFVGYVAHILANPDEYNQNGGSKKRFSGGDSIQELIAKIDKTGLTEGQINELNQITTAEDLKKFINTNLQKLTPEENEKIQEELKNKLTPEEKKIIKNDFPGFDLKDNETVFGFFGEKFLGGKQGGKPLTKRHRKKRQNKKRKSRKSKK